MSTTRKEGLNCKRMWTAPLGKQLREAGGEWAGQGFLLSSTGSFAEIIPVAQKKASKWTSSTPRAVMEDDMWLLSTQVCDRGQMSKRHLTFISLFHDPTHKRSFRRGGGAKEQIILLMYWIEDWLAGSRRRKRRISYDCVFKLDWKFKYQKLIRKLWNLPKMCLRSRKSRVW